MTSKEELISMKKYIRTKDKVYRVSDNLTEESIKLAVGDNCLKVGDTIEELCDGFWVISEEYDEPHYVKKLIDTNALDFENNWKPYGNGKVLDQTCQKLIDATIYGIIWIKGDYNEPILKSVAKMNNRGELELL